MSRSAPGTGRSRAPARPARPRRRAPPGARRSRRPDRRRPVVDRALPGRRHGSASRQQAVCPLGRGRQPRQPWPRRKDLAALHDTVRPPRQPGGRAFASRGAEASEKTSFRRRRSPEGSRPRRRAATARTASAAPRRRGRRSASAGA
ncbi:MAG: hypothetical protein E6J70_10430 [Deltaproteobacteria bacterium]|nr:MAG: hypothetical protein E6J70_10430 [Deltaproteobacteria bacterium]